jgi:hypothetical protein
MYKWLQNSEFKISSPELAHHLCKTYRVPDTARPWEFNMDSHCLTEMAILWERSVLN